VKKVIALLFVFTFVASTFAQDNIRIKDITVSSGRGALSSGLYVGINIDPGDTTANLTFEATADYVQAIYVKKFGILSIGPSAGYFQNAPWIGPFIKIQPADFISLVSWEGVSAGQANDPAFNVQYSFAYNSLRIDVAPVYVCFTTLSFQKDRLNCLVGSGFTIPLGKKISFGVSCDYSLRDSEPLFASSISYQF